MSYLVPIQALDSDNLSGLKYIWVIKASDVDQYPENFEGIAQEEIVFVSGRDWISWVATYSTSGLTSRSQDSIEGVSSGQELPFIIPRVTEANTVMLRKAEKDEFVVLAEDFNGIRYLFGSKEKPVRFAFDLNTGSGRDRNQYNCRFYSESPDSILIYPHTLGDGETDFSGCPSVIIRRGDSEGPILAVAPAGSTVVITSPYSFGYQIIAS
ncbi:hypothetical protein V8V91_08520 [Algoriphagus halophilus]|uniref:hypothetical protein n=1 Tax=Algoriphagus halophilus TaxID=226505 RepID=UPI00358F0381